MNRRVLSDSYNLQIVNPSLASEWHQQKNYKLSPQEVTPSQGIKVWWKCSKGHEWQATIDHRNKGRGCPYCAGKRACKDNCLQTTNSRLAKEWHPTRNGNITPKDITPGANKKVWWICNRKHEWQALINNRSKGIGCPYCSGRLADENNCLLSVNPTLAREWHPLKNNGLLPGDVKPGSDKKVWWVCSKGHEWQAVISSRNSGIGCPYCSGRLADKDTCLQKTNPKLAAEWHPARNGSLTPKDVKAGSQIKAWWICRKGHEWQAIIGSRNTGVGCPYCHFSTSQLELRIFTELKYFFADALHRKKIFNMECDVYIPSLRLARVYRVSGAESSGPCF
jgi:DNA-directed RNA polymerase subunit RPC12/RpoP